MNKDQAIQELREIFSAPASTRAWNNIEGILMRVEHGLDWGLVWDYVNGQLDEWDTGAEYISDEWAFRIDPSKIEITRAEGRIDECYTITVRTFAEAAAILGVWSQTAPEGGAYDKCDFVVTWKDGETYKGRYDLKNEPGATHCIKEHISKHVRFYAGLWCPEHLTPERYRQFLDREGDQSKKDHLAYLDRYRIDV